MSDFPTLDLEQLVWRGETRFDYAVCGLLALCLPLSIGLSPRLGYSFPWLLIASWALLFLATGIAVWRLRMGTLLQRSKLRATRAAEPSDGESARLRVRALETRRDQWFRAQMAIFAIGVLCNGLFLSANLYLNYVDQEQAAQTLDEASCPVES